MLAKDAITSLNSPVIGGMGNLPWQPSLTAGGAGGRNQSPQPSVAAAPPPVVPATAKGVSQAASARGLQGPQPVPGAQVGADPGGEVTAKSARELLRDLVLKSGYQDNSGPRRAGLGQNQHLRFAAVRGPLGGEEAFDDLDKVIRNPGNVAPYKSWKEHRLKAGLDNPPTRVTAIGAGGGLGLGAMAGSRFGLKGLLGGAALGGVAGANMAGSAYKAGRGALGALWGKLSPAIQARLKILAPGFVTPVKTAEVKEAFGAAAWQAGKGLLGAGASALGRGASWMAGQAPGAMNAAKSMAGNANWGAITKPLMTAGGGYAAGYGADTLAGMAGVDTGGRGAQIGTALGGMSGLPGRYMKMLPSSVRTGLTGVKQMAGGAAAPGNWAWNRMSSAVTGAPMQAARSAIAPMSARGKALAGAGLGLGSLGMARYGLDTVGETYGGARQDFADAAHERIMSSPEAQKMQQAAGNPMGHILGQMIPGAEKWPPWLQMMLLVGGGSALGGGMPGLGMGGSLGMAALPFIMQAMRNGQGGNLGQDLGTLTEGGLDQTGKDYISAVTPMLPSGEKQAAGPSAISQTMSGLGTLTGVPFDKLKMPTMPTSPAAPAIPAPAAAAPAAAPPVAPPAAPPAAPAARTPLPPRRPSINSQLGMAGGAPPGMPRPPAPAPAAAPAPAPAAAPAQEPEFDPLSGIHGQLKKFPGQRDALMKMYNDALEAEKRGDLGPKVRARKMGIDFPLRQQPVAAPM